MIVYTPEQKEIVDFLKEQLNPEGSNVVISGRGGTGKTTMLCQLIVELLRDTELRIAVTAATGKATAVLRSKIDAAIKEANIIPGGRLCIETITKITKKSQVLSFTESGETIYSNQWKNPKEFDYDVLFVDELSMVPHFISKWWMAAPKTRVFGFGDYCQLPEVVTTELKKDLDSMKHDLKLPQIDYISAYGIKVLKNLAHKELKTVLRSDNEVALICNDLRDFTMTKKEIVGVMKHWAKKTENIEYTTDPTKIHTEPSWQILAYTNKKCAEINNQLCKGKGYPILEDKILLKDNLNPLEMYNGDVMLFGDFLNKISEYNAEMRKEQKAQLYVCMKWQGVMPTRNSVNPIQREFYNRFITFKGAMQAVNLTRMANIKEIIKASEYAEESKKKWIADVDKMKEREPDSGQCFQRLLNHFNDIGERSLGQFIVDKSVQAPKLYICDADFGYCCTTHRSQGSEWDNICYILEKFDKPLIYTGISRAKKKVQIVNLTNEK